MVGRGIFHLVDHDFVKVLAHHRSPSVILPGLDHALLMDQDSEHPL